MRNVCLYLFLLLLSGAILGCKKENRLSWDKERACIQVDGQETCLPWKGGLRLSLVEGKAVLQPLNMEGLLGHCDFPQFGQPIRVAAATLDLQVLQHKLSLTDGKSSWADTSGLGLLLSLGDEGELMLRVPERLDAATSTYAFDTSGNLVGSDPPVRRIDFQEIKSQYYMALTRIEYIIGDDERRHIPNDTGTDVIIMDGFHYVGSCNAALPADCCPSGEGVSPELDYSGWVSDYADNGKRLLACFPAGSICTFTDGNKLIVYVCQTKVRYCLNFSTCPITITTTDGQGICFSVPINCSLENPFN